MGDYCITACLRLTIPMTVTPVDGSAAQMSAEMETWKAMTALSTNGKGLQRSEHLKDGEIETSLSCKLRLICSNETLKKKRQTERERER